MEPWNLISLEEARRRAEVCIGRIQRKAETVGLSEALGRISEADIVIREDSPAFDRSTVDGFAVRAVDTTGALESAPVFLNVVGEIRMGQPATIEVAKNQGVHIPTGGMMPVGADAVVMQEFTRRTVDGKLEVLRPVVQGENVIRKGDDAAAGSVVVRAGQRIGVPDIGVIASCGLDQVRVIKKPVVIVVTTGDEIIPPGTFPEPGQIFDVNSFTLSMLAESAGCESKIARSVKDSQEELLAVLKESLGKSDVILISGGSSVGDRDYTTAALAALSDVQIIFHGVSLKPGKPSLMAMDGNTVIFGIPGHTVAAMTVFQEIVEPALRILQGRKETSPQFVIQAKLGASLRPDKERDEIFRVRLLHGEEGVIAWPLPAKSGLITVMTRAHGIVRVKAGQREFSPGEMVDVEVLMDRVDGHWRGVML